MNLGSSLAVSLFSVLELLHRQDGGTLVSLDLLGIAHDEEDGHGSGNNPQDGTEADDDGLVDLNANAGQSVDGSADGERVNLLHQDGDAVVQGAGLGHHAEEAAQDHNEEADGQSVSEALNRGGAEIAQTGGSNRAAGRAGDDNGNHCNNCQQSKKNGER